MFQLGIIYIANGFHHSLWLLYVVYRHYNYMIYIINYKHILYYLKKKKIVYILDQILNPLLSRQ